MKKLLLPLTSIILFTSINSFAKDFEDKKYEVSAGISSGSIKSKAEEVLIASDFNGLDLSAGRKFNLRNKLTTTSQLNINFKKFDTSEAKADAEIKDIDLTMDSLELGVTQRLSYAVSMQDPIIRPFIELGYSRGNIETIASKGGEELTMELDYNKFKLGVGSQFVFKNGLAPYIKYEVSKIDFDDTGKFTVKGLGEDITEDITEDIELPKTDDQERSVSIGISFFF